MIKQYVNLSGLSFVANIVRRDRRMLIPHYTTKSMATLPFFRLVLRSHYQHGCFSYFHVFVVFVVFVVFLLFCVLVFLFLKRKTDISGIDWRKLKEVGFKGVIFDKDNTITEPYQLKVCPIVVVREKMALCCWGYALSSKITFRTRYNIAKVYLEKKPPYFPIMWEHRLTRISNWRRRFASQRASRLSLIQNTFVDRPTILKGTTTNLEYEHVDDCFVLC